MPTPITADDVLEGAHQPTGPITAQDVIDATPVDRKLQPQLVDDGGQDYNAADLDNVTSPHDIPNLRVEQRATGADQNVLPGSSGFAANFKAGFVEDPRTKIAQHAKALFPNDPNAEQRFGIREGKIVYIDDDLNVRDVDSGAGAKTGNALAYAPETVGGIVGSLATGNPVVGGALGAAAGKGLKEIIAGTLLDEPQTMAGNAAGMAKEGAISLVSGGVAKGAGALLNKSRVVDFTPSQAGAATATRDQVARQTGITLDLSQASGDPALASLRKYAAKFPGESAQIFKQLDELQTSQSADAMQKLVNKVSGAMSSEAAGKQGINAAQEAIRAARTSVRQQVGPLYDAAYKAVPVVDRTTKLGEKILDFLKLPYFPEAFSAGQKLRALETGSALKPTTRTVETLHKADQAAGTFERASTAVDSTQTGAQRITSKLTSGSRQQTPDGTLTTRSDTIHKDITGPSLAELDYTKRALDEQIQSLLDKGQRQRAGALIEKRNEFVKAIDAIPNQQWQAARKAYGDLAKSTLEPLENGAVGVLSKIKDPKAATAAAKLFSDPAITAREIAFARATMSKVDPDSWRALSGQYLATVLNRAVKVTQKGESTNIAGKLYQALAGTPEQAAKLRAALPADAQQSLGELLGALKLVAGTERAGSDTASNQLITRKIEGRFSTGLKWLRSPVQTAIQSGEERSLETMVTKLARGLTDPSQIAQLSQVSKASPGVQRGLQILSIIGAGTAQRAVADEVSPLSDMPIPAPAARQSAGTPPPTRGSR